MNTLFLVCFLSDDRAEYPARWQLFHVLSDSGSNVSHVGFNCVQVIVQATNIKKIMICSSFPADIFFFPRCFFAHGRSSCERPSLVLKSHHAGLVGRTHGPCVHARRMKHKCTIIRTDARAVRPYMQSNGYQQLTPCVPIAAILHAKMGDFAR